MPMEIGEHFVYKKYDLTKQRLAKIEVEIFLCKPVRQAVHLNMNCADVSILAEATFFAKKGFGRRRNNIKLEQNLIYLTNENQIAKDKRYKSSNKYCQENYSLIDSKQAKYELLEMFGRTKIKPQYYVVETNKVIAFGGYIKSWMNDYKYNIFWVNVDPHEQNKGFGKVVVSKIIIEIKKRKNAKVILLTADINKGNDHYYERNFGFKKILQFDKDKDCLMALNLENCSQESIHKTIFTRK